MSPEKTSDAKLAIIYETALEEIDDHMKRLAIMLAHPQKEIIKALEEVRGEVKKAMWRIYTVLPK